MTTDSPTSFDSKQTQALIYCRVSSTKQVEQGDGLGSQETRCREYAAHKGYAVAQVFREEGITGAIIERPGMKALLAHLRQHRHKAGGLVVIIDDISRLARDIKTHIDLRTTIASAGGKLESPSIEFGEDSDSQLIEHLLASVAQHQREKNKEQVCNRMRARLMNGYWCFPPPVGYVFEMVSGHGKLMVKHEKTAVTVTAALERFASGHLATPAEVKRFLERHAAFPKTRHGEVTFQAVSNLLNQPLYAGLLCKPNWGLNLIPAKHEPLIDTETWFQIQKRLNSKPTAPVRKDISEDFPLRGFVACSSCGHPLTGAWSRGNGGRYGYYTCHQRDCALKRKSIAKAKVEGDFENLLKAMRPSRTLFALAYAMFRDLWHDRLASVQDNAAALRRDLSQVGQNIDRFLDRIADADSAALITTYESRIKALEEKRLLLEAKIDKSTQPQAGFEESFRTAFGFLANPWKLWASERLEDRRTVLKLVFAAPLAYCKNHGFRTVRTTRVFKALGRICDSKSKMVEPRTLA